MDKEIEQHGDGVDLLTFLNDRWFINGLSIYRKSLIERHFKLPVIWKEGGTARAATGNKLQVVEVFTEVKP